MTSKPNNGAALVHARAQERAEYLYVSYYSLGGSNRSIARLHALLSGLGLKISLGTLKNYSSKGKWIERALADDAANLPEQRRQANALSERVTELNHRHGQYGVALQRMSVSGLRTLDPSSFSPSDVTSMMEKGIKLERLAEGQATDRHELTVQIVEPLVRQIVMLFQQVNVVDDEAKRLREFGLGADRIIEQSFGEQALETWED